MDAERVLFLGVTFATHGVVGYALVRGFTDLNPRVGFVLALVPDVDIFFPTGWGEPFVHRGITHSPAFVLVVVAVGIVASAFSPRLSREIPLATVLATGSHLAIDSLSPEGIPWLFPFASTASGGGLPVHGPVGTLVLWALAIGILVWRTDVGSVPSRSAH